MARSALLCVLLPIVLVGCGGRAATPAATGRIDHVVVLMLENQARKDVLGTGAHPYLDHLAQRYASASRYYGVAHPSQPNYLAAIGGSTFGVTDDDPHVIHASNLVDQLERHGQSWAAYMQGLPRPGFLGAKAGDYAAKHDPFLSFADVRDSRRRRALVEPFDAFAADARRALPDFVWISPDQCHDLHGAPSCSDLETLRRDAGAVVRGVVETLQSTSAWHTESVVLVVTTDEADGDDPEAPVPMIVVANRGPAHGFVDRSRYNHYSLLATIEDGLGLPRLRKAAKARVMQPFLHP